MPLDQSPSAVRLRVVILHSVSSADCQQSYPSSASLLASVRNCSPHLVLPYSAVPQTHSLGQVQIRIEHEQLLHAHEPRQSNDVVCGNANWIPFSCDNLSLLAAFPADASSREKVLLWNFICARPCRLPVGEMSKYSQVKMASSPKNDLSLLGKTRCVTVP